MSRQFHCLTDVRQTWTWYSFWNIMLYRWRLERKTCSNYRVSYNMPKHLAICIWSKPTRQIKNKSVPIFGPFALSKCHKKWLKDKFWWAKIQGFSHGSFSRTATVIISLWSMMQGTMIHQNFHHATKLRPTQASHFPFQTRIFINTYMKGYISNTCSQVTIFKNLVVLGTWTLCKTWMPRPHVIQLKHHSFKIKSQEIEYNKIKI